jgi:hypothetical protein
LQLLLGQRQTPTDLRWRWIGMGALLGFTTLAYLAVWWGHARVKREPPPPIPPSLQPQSSPNPLPQLLWQHLSLDQEYQRPLGLQRLIGIQSCFGEICSCSCALTTIYRGVDEVYDLNCWSEVHLEACEQALHFDSRVHSLNFEQAKL